MVILESFDLSDFGSNPDSPAIMRIKLYKLILV